MYHNMHVEVKQQPSGICFLLPPQIELSLPAESSYQPKTAITLKDISVLNGNLGFCTKEIKGKTHKTQFQTCGNLNSVEKKEPRPRISRKKFLVLKLPKNVFSKVQPSKHTEATLGKGCQEYSQAYQILLTLGMSFT